MTDLIKKHHEMIKTQAAYFYKLNLKTILDFEDYYQEACLSVLRAEKTFNPKKGQEAQYFRTCISNDLTLLACINASHINVPPRGIKIASQIFSLDQKGYESEDIIKKLNISKKDYFNFKDVMNRAVLHGNLSKKINTIKIQDCLNDYDIKLFELLLKDASVKEIAKEFKITYNKAYITVKKLLNKIKDNYYGTEEKNLSSGRV